MIVKMSEIFKLPVIVFSIDYDDNFGENHNSEVVQYEAATMAINAYDDNQESIKSAISISKTCGELLELTTNQQQTIDELKSLVVKLNGALDGFDRYASSQIDYRNSPFCAKVRHVLNKTPTQCLNEIKAGAVEGCAKDLNSRGYLSVGVSDVIFKYANKLREGSK